MTEPRETVLFVTHDRYFGGSAVSLRTVLRRLDPALRRAVAVPSGGNVGSELEREGLVDAPVPIPWTSWRAGRSRLVVTARAASAVARWAVRHRRQLAAIHANGVVDLGIAAPTAALTRVPLVVWAHDADIDTTTRRVRFLIAGAQRVASRIEWVAVSSAAAEVLVDAGADASRVVVVPNPIEDTTIGPRASSSRVRIGFLGTDTRVKGFDLLPDIVEGLDRPGALLLVFSRHHTGLPADMEHTWERLEALSPGRVEVLGRQDDVGGVYGRCDIVLCPSREESFGRTAAEAMLNALPVVATDLPAVREVVGDDAGILVPRDDVAATVGALRRLVDDVALRRRLGEAGRARARAFGPDVVVRKLEALYRGVNATSASGRARRRRSA